MNQPQMTLREWPLAKIAKNAKKEEARRKGRSKKEEGKIIVIMIVIEN